MQKILTTGRNDASTPVAIARCPQGLDGPMVLYPRPASSESEKRTAEEEAAAKISSRIEELYEQTRLAAEARDPLLLESILRELTILNDMQCYLADPDSNCEPLRAILEFLDGDMDRPPCVFPMAGTLEADNRLRREIRQRWNQQ